MFGDRVYRLTPDLRLSSFATPVGLAPAVLAVHRDGRLFIAGLGNFKDTGGVYYVSPDGKTTTSTLLNLAVANGVALSPDGKTLWTDELSGGVLHKVELSDATIAPFGTSVPDHFIGPAPDSMRVDADGNLYVAIYGQGRILVFNATGLPIGQILIPGDWAQSSIDQHGVQTGHQRALHRRERCPGRRGMRHL